MPATNVLDSSLLEKPVPDANPYEPRAAEQEEPSTGRNLLKPALLVVGVIGLFVAFRYLPVGEHVDEFVSFAEGLGVWGLLVLAVVYIIATVFMLPGSILTLGAGAAFGPVQGTLAVMVGSVLGALAAFLVGRYFAREFVEQKAKDNPKFNAIDQAVGREGFKIVLLTRLSPIFPFNLLNYLFSITNVRTRDYFLASWLGMIPGTIMYVYVGYAARKASQDLSGIAAGEDQGGWGETILLVIGLVATIAVTVIVTRIARKVLREYAPEAVEGEGEEPDESKV